jgi:hypothetical protein
MNNFFKKKEVKALLGKYGTCGNNIKLYLKITGSEGVVWIRLAQDMGQ